MGFFGRLFKGKRGGTRVGNFIRQLAWDNSGIGTEHLLGRNINAMSVEQRMEEINPNAGGSVGGSTGGNQMFWGD